MSWTDAKWFSDQAGQKTEVTQSSNVQRGRFHVTTDRGGASQSETKANLVNPDEIQRIGETELVALIGERPPVRLTQRRYFDDDEVKDRGGIVPPMGPARLDGPRLPCPRGARPKARTRNRSTTQRRITLASPSRPRPHDGPTTWAQRSCAHRRSRR